MLCRCKLFEKLKEPQIHLIWNYRVRIKNSNLKNWKFVSQFTKAESQPPF